jgi:hypothetical protein
MRVLTAIAIAGALALTGSHAVQAQGDGGYRLVSDWPKLPSGM